LFYHAPSGLYLTHYRAYDPVTARWLSRDPIGEAGGVNLYGYVGGNPLSYTDPLGLAAQICSKLWHPHTFLCVDGNCSGKYPSGNPFISPGEIRDDSPNKSSASCSDVPSNGCDQNSFEQCIAKRLANRGSSGDLYNYSYANCGQWAEDVIQQCRNECTKK
jgi:RHS repeat-associated protein